MSDTGFENDPVVVALNYVAGDTARLDFVFGSSGAPVDLSVYAAIKLRLRRCDGTMVQVTATIDDAASGKAHFDFGSSDLIAGMHRAEFYFDKGEGGGETWPKRAPIYVHVRAKA